MPDYDVIVVGAGFAGLTAARELSHRGRSVLLVEARDRIGGRTWAAENRMGRRLELGGAWVHWTQPHVWAEISRYGIELVASPEARQAVWFVGGERREGTPEELFAPIMAANEDLLADARVYFPNAFAPLANPAAAEIDDIGLLERIDALGLPPDDHERLVMSWLLSANGAPADVAFTTALRWVGLTNGSFPVFIESAATYKFRDGTSALADAMGDDSGAERRLGTPVRRLRQDADAVSVTLADGAVVTAGAAVVTLPLHALRELDAEWAPERRAAIAAGQASAGFKCWIRIRGEQEVVAFGRPDFPLGLVFAEYVGGGETILVGMGPDATAIDLDDRAGVAGHVQRLLPGAEVLEVVHHDWVADPFARETWPVPGPGALARLAVLQEPEGRIVLAGSDYASGWTGYIDGAIESGFAAVHAVNRVLDGGAGAG